MSEELSSGAKQMIEGLYDSLTKKHAMECAKVMKEHEEIKGSANDTNEEDGAKDQEWKNKIEEIFSLMKE